MNTIEKALEKLQSSKDSKASVGNTKRIDVSSSRLLQMPWEDMKQKGMLTPEEGRSQIAEEMRAIKRPLLKNAFPFDGKANGRNNLIMVTSSVPGEGKSFSSINLAVSIAMELDRTALLVDADVARPSIARYLGFQADKGLIDYLMDQSIEIPDILIKTDLPKLSILPSGRRHQHSTELLASENMLAFLDEISQRYHDRVIVFDSPPLLATSEAQVLATQVGQVVLVVEAVQTSQVVLKEALGKIPDANVAGLILNKTRVKAGGSYYGKNYEYGSGNDPKDVA